MIDAHSDHLYFHLTKLKSHQNKKAIKTTKSKYKATTTTKRNKTEYAIHIQYYRCTTSSIYFYCYCCSGNLQSSCGGRKLQEKEKLSNSYPSPSGLSLTVMDDAVHVSFSGHERLLLDGCKGLDSKVKFGTCGASGNPCPKKKNQ